VLDFITHVDTLELTEAKHLRALHTSVRAMYQLAVDGAADEPLETALQKVINYGEVPPPVLDEDEPDEAILMIGLPLDKCYLVPLALQEYDSLHENESSPFLVHMSLSLRTALN
jgi:hypothetical protein